RPRKFAFEAALEVQAFLELGDAELLAVENLETDGAAPGQPLAGKLEPDVVDPVAGYQDRAAAGSEAVGHLELGQGGDDGTAVAVLEIGEQDAIVALLRVEEGGCDDGGERRDTEHQDQQLADRQGGEATERGCGAARCGEGCVHRGIVSNPGS